MKRFAAVAAALLLLLSGCGRGFGFDGGGAMSKTEYERTLAAFRAVVRQTGELRPEELPASAAEEVASLLRALHALPVRTEEYEAAAYLLAETLRLLEDAQAALHKLKETFRSLAAAEEAGADVSEGLALFLEAAASVREPDRSALFEEVEQAARILNELPARLERKKLLEELAAFTPETLHAGLYEQAASLAQRLKAFPNVAELDLHRERLAAMLVKLEEICRVTAAIGAACEEVLGALPAAVSRAAEIEALLLDIDSLNAVDKAAFSDRYAALSSALAGLRETLEKMAAIRAAAEDAEQTPWELYDRDVIDRVRVLLAFLPGFAEEDAAALSAEKQTLCALLDYLERKFAFP